MAIILQLASAPPKASAASAASPVAGRAEPVTAVQPFAAIIDDLLKTSPALANAASDEGELPEDAEPADTSSADASTQALLASLSLLPQAAVPPVVTPSSAASSAAAAPEGNVAPMAAALIAASNVEPDAELTAAGRLPTAGAEQAPSGAEPLALTPDPAAGRDRKLPDVAANLAVPAVDGKSKLIPFDVKMTDPLPVASSLTDTGALRPAAAGSPSHAQAPSPAYAVAEPVGGSRWADAIGQRAMFMVDQQVKSAELHLNPPHLGPLEIKLALDGDKASISFSTNQAAVREALQQSLPKLHQVFADNGLAELNVQVHLGQQQQPQQQDRPAGQAALSAEADDGVIESRTRVQSARWHSQSHATARGGVDIFA